MSGPVMHPTFWSTTLELVFLIILPIVIWNWPRRDKKVKSQPMPEAPPRDERAGYINMKMERFEKPR